MGRPRYLVFCEDEYYPAGGIDGLVYAGNSREEAEQWIQKCKFKNDWGELWDLETGKVEVYYFDWEKGEIVEKKVKNLQEEIEAKQEWYK